MSAYFYRAYGVTIKSDVTLPYLLGSAKNSTANISIQQAAVSPKGIRSATVRQLHFQASTTQLWLDIPGVVRFSISKGSQIKYQVHAHCDEQTLGLYLIGTALGIALQQRGLIVLQAMAIKHGDQAVVFAAHSGNGKTTLAAVMHKQGYEILCDDLCVIDDKNRVLPGYPVLKLWQDCFKVMEIQPGQLKRIRPQVHKYAYIMHSGFAKKPLTVKSIYILNSWNRDKPEIQSIKGMKKLIPLQSQFWKLQYLQAQNLMPTNPGNLLRLAGAANLQMMTRPQVDYKVSHLIDFFEQDCTQTHDKHP